MEYLLAFVPLALVLEWQQANPVLVFFVSAVSIIPLAKIMGDSTEALADILGPTKGGLLNATLGNAPEIIISLFALHQGLVDIVKASITGSIVTNLLLGMGLAMFAGGLKRPGQNVEFDMGTARMSGVLLFLAAFGLIIPTVFSHSVKMATVSTRAAEISIPIAVLLLLIYLASFVFTLQRSSIDPPELPETLAQREAETAQLEKSEKGKRALLTLTLVTIALAVMSETLTNALEPATGQLGLTPLFAGVFLLALLGNTAELFNAVRFARDGKLDLSLGITVGASIQVALVVVPVLVFFGYLIGQPMNLRFSFLELVAIILAVLVTRNLISDGKTNWLEGLCLLIVYFMLGVGFYYAPLQQTSPL